MFWWGLYGWTPLSCPWGCLVRSARVWTFWFFLVPWLPLGLGDFLVVLLGWSSVLGLRIVGGLTLWWLSPLCLACIGMLIHPYLSYYTNVFGSSLVFLFGWKMWRINSNVRDIWTMACFGLNICISYKINRKSQIHSYDLLFLSLTLFFCFKATLKFSNIDMLSTFSVGKANFPTHILTVSVTSLHISGPFSTWCSMCTVGMGAPG